MKSIAKSGKNTLKKKTTAAKYVQDKQRTFTIKNDGEKTYVRSALSWLYAAPVMPEWNQTPVGPKKKAT